MPMRRLDLDHAATTPLHPDVRRAMLPWLDAGNPSALHEGGRRARAVLDAARETVAAALDAEFADVVFTSGGTEGANLALVGVALAYEGTRRRILMSGAEHHCVLHTQPLLERLGYQIQELPVGRDTRPEPVRLPEDTFLVSVMSANNESGARSDLAAFRAECDRVGALLHVDAVQTFGKEPLPVRADLVNVSGHKLNGPKGIGVVAVRPGVRVRPLVAGGAQERERRGGTEHVAGAVGLAAALGLPPFDPAPARDAFLARLTALGFVPTVTEDVLPGHVHGRFPGREAQTLLIRLDRLGVGASAGAACSSGSLEPSHVMVASGYGPIEAREAVRFTFGRGHTAEMAEEAAERVAQALDSVHKVHA